MSRKVLREVLSESRQGRGRWWRPAGSGYTDDLCQAGVFESGADSHGQNFKQVDAVATLRGELAAAEERCERLAGLLEQAEHGP